MRFSMHIWPFPKLSFLKSFWTCMKETMEPDVPSECSMALRRSLVLKMRIICRLTMARMSAISRKYSCARSLISRVCIGRKKKRFIVRGERRKKVEPCTITSSLFFLTLSNPLVMEAHDLNLAKRENGRNISLQKKGLFTLIPKRYHCTERRFVLKNRDFTVTERRFISKVKIFLWQKQDLSWKMEIFLVKKEDLSQKIEIFLWQKEDLS